MKKINLPLIFILIIFLGFLINVFNERSDYPFSQLYGWGLVILGTMGFLIEGIIKGRFR